MLKGNIFSTLFTCYGTQPSLGNMEHHYQARQSVSKFAYTNTLLFIVYTYNTLDY